MKAKEIVKAWNESKKVNRSLGTDERPSDLVVKIDTLISQFGEELVTDYFTDLCVRNDVSTDIGNYLSFNLVATYKKDKEQGAMSKDSQVISILGKELITLMGTELANKTEALLKEKLDAYVQDKVISKVYSIKDLPEVKFDEVTHEKFETVLKFVAMDEPVMLVGPAGTGKNVIAEQIARVLNTNFYFTSAVTQEYKLTGYGDANGNYVPTQFYDWAVNGGVFLFDEMDASIPEALVVVNSAIANRYFDFPVVGRVKLNENCRIIACANTFGTGATTEYVGRNQLDAATLNRFALIEIDYDARIEEFVSKGNKDVLDFCREFRRICQENGTHCIISYREIGRLAKMIDCAHLSEKEAIKTCVVKGLEQDTLRIICSDMQEVAYKRFLKELVC